MAAKYIIYLPNIIVMKEFFKRLVISLKILFKSEVNDQDLLYLFETKNLRLLNRLDLSKDQEVFMVNFGSMELFQWFVRFRGLRLPAQLAVLKNKDFFDHYVGLYKLYSDAEAALIETKDEELILSYTSVYQLSPKADQLMLKTCDRNIILPYLKKKLPLIPT